MSYEKYTIEKFIETGQRIRELEDIWLRIRDHLYTKFETEIKNAIGKDLYLKLVIHLFFTKPDKATARILYHSLGADEFYKLVETMKSIGWEFTGLEDVNILFVKKLGGEKKRSMN